jgi:CheY-like chemotaxis protein
MKVLIVDDDTELSHLLKLSLQVGFYEKAKHLVREGQALTDCLEVEQFREAKGALEYLQTTSEHIDLIFSELDIPGMDGYAFLDICRKKYRDKYDDIIIVTERGHKQDVKKAIMAGASDYILKPFEPEELTEHVFQAWNKRTQRLSHEQPSN